jgi:hypothetical protein
MMPADHTALRIVGLIVAAGAACIFVCALYLYAVLTVLVVGDEAMATQEDEL